MTLKKNLLITSVLMLVLLFSTLLFAEEALKKKSGKALFEKHCAVCHPDGGNRLNPEQTLHRKDLEANGFRTPQDIVQKMRNPGAFSPHAGKWSSMKTFDEKTLSNKEALKIAEYTLNTFK